MTAYAGRLASLGVHLAARSLARRRLSILIYLRVLPQADAINTWDVTAEEFEAQMAQLAMHFTPLPLPEAIERLGAGALPPGAVSVTFDDGYADNLTVALPILRRHGIHATFFIATDYLNGGRMWNDTVVEAVRAAQGEQLDLSAIELGPLPLGDAASRGRTIDHILKRIKHRPPRDREAAVRYVESQVGAPLPDNLMLTDAQVVALHRAGMTIGGHTASHPILANLPAPAAREEICTGRERLVELLREPVFLFAYPNGKPVLDFGYEHVEMVRAAGFTAALTTAHGVAGAACDRYQLPRQGPWDRNPVTFSLRLAGSYLGSSSQTLARAS
jgi:peptidoglycan/xylan/chitin deacetylase (PgdA/CDA1 family)